MKTIHEWFKELPEEYRDNALNNAHDMILQFIAPANKFPNAASALAGSFDWQESPEGFDYWKTLHRIFLES